MTMSYLDRLAYVRGTADLTDKLSHKMCDEWLRGDTWSDWAGVNYDGTQIWEYVNGPAAVADCTPGVRDASNAGVTPEGFRNRANAHIRSRLPDAPRTSLLSLDEVLALRIYTGPGYQPLNGWLRYVGKLDAAERRRAAMDPSSAYGATVGQLVRAIRKLAAANTPEENRHPLYRGLRGVLPWQFWHSDDAGYVCASDSAFMSTSTAEATPIHYMAKAPQPNLLWELRAGDEDEAGHHCGADVSMLSQFSGERECLFPPLTMLKVVPREEVEPAVSVSAGASADGAPHAVRSHSARERWARIRAFVRGGPVTEREHLLCFPETRGDKHFERVVVVPTFA